MSVPLAFCAVVLIWSTTPLGIQWSNTSLSPEAAIAGRMLLAWLLVAVAGLFVARQPMALKTHWRSYLTGSIGIFPAMFMVYQAAQYVPSGLIAVFFGLSVFVNALLATWILGERAMSKTRYLALMVSLSGLVIVSLGQLRVDVHAAKGVGLLLFAVLCYSLSSVLTKRYGAAVAAVNQMQGSLLFALPGLVIAWLLLDGSIPRQVESRSVFAVLYLVIVATIIGFSLFFYLLQRVSAVSIGLIPLMTPVLAIWIGNVFNDESATSALLVGSGLVVMGLGLFNLTAIRGWMKVRRLAR